MNLNFNPNQDFSNAILDSGKPLMNDGWHIIRITEISEPHAEKSGKGTGVFVTFQEASTGLDFSEYFCVEVASDNDNWRVQKTELFFSYLARLLNVNLQDLSDLIGLDFEADITRRTIPGRKTIDPSTYEEIESPSRTVNEIRKGGLIMNALRTAPNYGEDAPF